MGANIDITSVIDAHRQVLREGGIVQAPAPTENAVAIECPINMRRDSIRVTKRAEPAEGVYKVTCLVDLDEPALLRVKLSRRVKE